MGHFGFSYIGLLWLIMLFIPNIFWTRCKPEGYDPRGENKVLAALERRMRPRFWILTADRSRNMPTSLRNKRSTP
ncbi:MAG: hypothetical protein ACLRL0_02305 [Christensenellaceae bacterium]